MTYENQILSTNLLCEFGPESLKRVIKYCYSFLYLIHFLHIQHNRARVKGAWVTENVDTKKGVKEKGISKMNGRSKCCKL